MPEPTAEMLIDWTSIEIPTVAITVPVAIELAPGVMLSDTAAVQLTLAIDAEGRVYGSAEVEERAQQPMAAAPIAVPTVVSAVATCNRMKVERIGHQDVSLCVERNGDRLDARSLSREELGFWFAELAIPSRYLARAYAMSQCEAGGQWTAFWIDGQGNRMVGPFAINWRFFAAPAAEDVGRPLDPFNDRDYMTMLGWLLDRSGWGLWGCCWGSLWLRV